MKKFFSLISIILIFTMLAVIFPVRALASENRADISQEQSLINSQVDNQSNAQEKSNAKIIGELEEKRDINVKHFLKEDLTYEACVYPVAVHYRDGQYWKDIDNTLIANKDADGKDIVVNKDNDFKVRIAKTANANKLISIKNGNYELSWNIKRDKISEKQNNQNLNQFEDAVNSNSESNNNIEKQSKLFFDKRDSDKGAFQEYSPIESKQSLEISSILTTPDSINTSITENQVSEKEFELPHESQVVINETAEAFTSEEFSEDEKKMMLTKLSSSSTFSNIFENVDLKYDIVSESLKESIIIKNPIDFAQFSFDINIKNLSPVKLKNQDIAFYDNKNLSNEVFRFQAPYMFDAEGNVSHNINVSFEKTDKGYQLILAPDNNWLLAPERKYPITIDPDATLSVSLQGNDISDTYVSNQFPTTNYSKDPFLVLQRNSPTESEIYVNFNLPSCITTNDFITEAIFVMNSYSSSVPGKQVAYRITQPWDPAQIVWNNKPECDSRIEDYQSAPGGADITRLVNDWYENGNCYGIVIKPFSDKVGISYNSSRRTTSRPYLKMSYISNTGIENGWSFHTQSVGRAGVGYVNDANGNLVVVHNDLVTSGSRMPVSIQHVYNRTDASDPDFSAYAGWKISLYQKIIKVDVGTTQYYAYVDEDGTKVFFKKTTTGYADGIGRGLNLTPNTDGTYKMVNKGGIIWNFSASGRLSSITDNNGNKLEITYDSDTVNVPGAKITSVIDGAGRITAFNYTDNLLTSIVGPGNDTVSYEYTDDKLTKIIYNDSKFSTYRYDENGCLTDIIDIDGYQINYSYYTQEPFRVKGILEKNIDGTLGEELNVDYALYTTAFTDIKGRKNTYTFNQYGNPICILDSNGYAQYYKFYNDSSLNNKLASVSKLQKPVMNYIRNHNFEKNIDWNAENLNGSNGTANYSTPGYIGTQSIYISKTNDQGASSFTQQVNLQKGNSFTLSGFIKTENISNVNNGGASLNITYIDNGGIEQKVSSNSINGTKSWQRYDVSFNLPEDAQSSSVIVRLGITGETGKAYFDCIQMEEGLTANRYNLVEDPDLTTFTDYWTKVSSTGKDSLISLSEQDYPSSLNNNCYKVTESQYGTGRVLQTIKVSGAAGDVFTFGGWGKGESVSLKDTLKEFCLRLRIVYNDYDTEELILPFNEGSNDWQYVSGQIIASEPYRNIDIYGSYTNANTAYFDGFQLYKEGFEYQYKYDSNGNRISLTNPMGDYTEYGYNSNNDLFSSRNANGGLTQYTYDSKHNPITSKNSCAGGEYIYDSYGNQITSDITDNNPAMEYYFIRNTFTYSDSGNYLKTMTDALGNTVSYNYDEEKGTLDSVTDAKSQTTIYRYDSMKRLTESYAIVGNSEVRNSYTYENDNLKMIEHNGFNYSFNYDSLGNNTQVLVNEQPLITNTYEERTSIPLETTYGNGQNISYKYDNLDRVVEKLYNGSPIECYKYDASGNVAIFEDLVNNVSYKYYYDSANRCIREEDSLGNSQNYMYKPSGKVSRFTEIINGNTYYTNYNTDNFDRQTRVTLPSQNYVGYGYDVINRLSSKITNVSGASVYKTDYTFYPGIYGAKSTTNLMKSINNNGSIISYTYDANGNIETITEGNDNSGYTIKYYYDELNELIREDNRKINTTITYDYDAGGNILSKSVYPFTTEAAPSNSIKVYTYSYDDVWKDKLIGYDGSEITYDEIGNPLSDGTYTYTWEMGRQLSSMSKDGLDIYFKYNSEGIRTEKTVNGVSTKYHVIGDKVTYQDDGTDKIYYTYDANSNLVSMVFDGIEYYYIRNGQSDIIGLFDSKGTQVVSYTYDTWGKLISTTGSLAATVGAKNPYLYRSYRYDRETGLYYLQSRYYNPEFGRFINADDNLGNPGELLTHNLFAYCVNNPVMYVDPDGHIFMLVTGLIGAVAGGIVGGVVATATGKNVWAGIGIGIVSGGAIGLTCGAAAAYIAAGSATASTGAVMAGMGYGVAGGGTIVIGQSMSRVIDKAQEIGAEVYSGLKYYDRLKEMFGEKVADFIGKADNALWIINKMANNYKIVDIGIDTTKALGKSSYILESILTFFYKNKEIAEEYFKGVF